MSRVSFVNRLTLEELVDRYAWNKSELDGYKKLVDSDNAEIKQRMLENNLTECVTPNYIAKYVVSNRETINEDKLLSVCKQFNLDTVIKTKEYVDMDAFENFMYHNSVSEELLAAIDSCRIPKEVVSLRISINKKGDTNV